MGRSRRGGSYESVVRGVSEQAPQDRRSGQMWEQVNMVSDPVRGLVRRHGSMYMASRLIKSTPVENTQLEDSASKFTVMDYFCNGDEFDVLYTKKKLADRPALEDPIHCYNKTTNSFLNINGHGAVYAKMKQDGIASMVNIGKYLFIAANGYAGTWSIVSDVEKETEAKRGVVWIRNGDFGRTYKITITQVDGTTKTVSYETPKSTYPGKLDTSQIPVPTFTIYDEIHPDHLQRKLAQHQSDMAEYNKKVADVQNEYNSEVTKYVGEAAKAIQPENIAKELAERIKSALGTDRVWADGAYILIDTGANVRGASVEDGGDGTFMRTAITQADAPENLTPKHFYGKIMRITAKKQTGKDAYYLKAFPKSNTGTSFGEVVWREAAGETTTPIQFFAMGLVKGDTLHIYSNPKEMAAAFPDDNIPQFKPSTVGDTLSSPIPAFFGKQIDYLGIFQDRLLIGNGATIFASRPGDYFNWFRSSVLTVDDSDPVEMFALGSEDDTIHWDTSFDRNHVLFGRKYQYLIPGRTLMSPKNPSIQVMSANEDAVEAEPQSSSNFVFYAKDTAKKGSLHQIQMGATSDSSESYECSQQLDKYIRGKPVQIMCNTAPFVVMLRTSQNPYGVYLYTYLDSMQGTERLFDSWSRWEWDSRLGPSVGMSRYQGDIFMYTARNTPGGLHIVCDKFTIDSDLSEYPYCDSHRPLGIAIQYPLWWHAGLNDGMVVAANSLSDYFLLGSEYLKLDRNIPNWKEWEDYMNIGMSFTAYFIPTSPYPRDYNDKPIVSGRTTLQQFLFAIMDTSGFIAHIETSGRSRVVRQYDGRTLTREHNVVGRTPIVTGVEKVNVGKEIREFKLRMCSKDWLPFSVTGIEWTGQLHNKRGRV